MNSAHEVELRLLMILMQLCIIILAARFFAGLFRKINQPSVVGEIAAGIILGPSVFGWLFPELSNLVFPPDTEALGRDVSQALRVMSQLGLIFLLFLIGLEFDFDHLRAHWKSALGVSITGILLPFGLGIALAIYLHPRLNQAADLLGFALFMGTAMSITALPVLARMMQELRITRAKLAVITITAAAMDDAVGWILLAAVTAMIRSEFELLRSVIMIVESIAFALFMVSIVKPYLLRAVRASLARNSGELSMNLLAVMLVLLFCSSMITSMIGIFAIFGAFLFGAILSEEEGLRKEAHRLLHNFVTVFFLPIFFTYTGLRTNVGLLTGIEMWVPAFLVCLVAIVGKLAGCSFAAYRHGFSRNESFCIGALMNTRGLMELIVVNVGYELGVIPQTVFSMLVIMALLTTVMTCPLLLAFRRGTELQPHLETWQRS